MNITQVTPSLQKKPVPPKAMNIEYQPCEDSVNLIDTTHLKSVFYNPRQPSEIILDTPKNQKPEPIYDSFEEYW